MWRYLTPKKSSVLVARNGLGGFSDGNDGYVPAIVAAGIHASD